MASSSVIGALRVVLGADTASFEGGLKGAEKTLAKFQANMNKAGAAIGAALGTAVIALGVSIKNAIDQADKLGKMAQSFGIPVEQLSALAHAADLSGVSIEEVGKSVGRLARSMAEVAGGKAIGGAVDAFRALKIDVTSTSGALKSSNQVLEEVAERFAKMEDGAGKTALAIQIFGRAGANMIPLLNLGADGLREAAKEAEALGLIIDTKTAKAAESFNDNLTRLGRVQTGTALKITAELAPALNLLTTRIVDYVKENDVATQAAHKIIAGFDIIGRAAATTAHVFTSLAREAAALWDVLRAPSIAAVAEAWKKFQEEGERSRAGVEAISTTFRNFREEADMLSRHTENVAAGFKKVAAPVAQTRNALDAFIASQAKALASLQADAATIGMSAGARERLRVIMQAESVARENNIRLTAAQQVQITQLANAMQQAALQQQGYNLLLETAEPHEKFRLEMAQNAAALAAVGATAEQIARVGLVTAEKFGATWEQVTASAAGGFAALATEMGKSNSKIATVAKAFAIVEATINTYVAFTKALASTPPPFNYVLAAGVLAAGLAKVAAIKSQNVPKMATGGILRTPGMPGQDSQLLTARVRPDEQVEVTRPGERGPLGGGPVSTIILQFNSRAMREFWAEGIDQINALGSDGYRLKVAG